MSSFHPSLQPRGKLLNRDCNQHHISVNVLDTDILSGAAPEVYIHPGNLTFYGIVDKYAAAYGRATCKDVKIDIQQCILKEVLCDGPCRVLKKHPVFAAWYVAANTDNRVLKDKISHLLRDYIKKKKRSSSMIVHQRARKGRNQCSIVCHQGQHIVPGVVNQDDANALLDVTLMKANMQGVPTAADCVTAFFAASTDDEFDIKNGPDEISESDDASCLSIAGADQIFDRDTNQSALNHSDE